MRLGLHWIFCLAVSTGIPIPTQCFALQTQWFCYIDTVILLRKHTTFPPLILSALLTYIQAHHDSIDNPRYQPPPRPQPRRCRLRCRHWKPCSPPGYIHVGIRCGETFFGIFPKGEKCCQNILACYVYIVLMKLFTTPRSQSLPLLLPLLLPSPSQPSPPLPLPLLLLQPSL